MESSDSDDEEDRVSVRHRGQIDRLAREDDYYPFVSDLIEEDYILMRDNNLLGPLGESTEEEMQKRLQIMKENLRRNSDENTDRGDASDNESSEDSLLDWLTTSGQTENVTSEQKENQSWREESEISANSDELRFGLESNLECDDEYSNPENEYVASAKLPRREDTEDSQRSSDEDSEISSPTFEDSEERSSSTGFSETGQEDGRMTPIIDDDSDSGSSLNLEQFLLLHEADPHQPTGLSELQINNLPLRFSEEEDATKICTICITEYTAGNMLRILPCSHEYHYQCIDQWLAEHSTCPICREPIVDHSEADDSM